MVKKSLKQKYKIWNTERKIRMIHADEKLLKKRYENSKNFKVYCGIFSLIWLFSGILLLVGFVKIIDMYRQLPDSINHVTIILLGMAMCTIIGYVLLQHILYAVYMTHENSNMAHISLIEKLNEMEKKIDENKRNGNRY